MRRNLLIALGVLMVGLSLYASRAEAAVFTTIYDGFGFSGGGAPYSNPVGSFSTSDVLFATHTGYSWHPFGRTDFGADISGVLNVATGGTHTFTLNSDDGSQLYIDNALVVDDGGVHAPGIATGSTALTAGAHSFEVQFFECCGDPAGVDLYLPSGVTYSVPEPATWFLLPGALGLIGGFSRRRKPTRV